jgi:hypothetical protein
LVLVTLLIPARAYKGGFLKASLSTTPAVHPELPFSAAVVSITLNDDQRAQIAPLITQAAINGSNVLFLSAAPFYSTIAGQTLFRLQAAVVDRKVAAKIVNLIRYGKVARE